MFNVTEYNTEDYVYVKTGKRYEKAFVLKVQPDLNKMTVMFLRDHTNAVIPDDFNDVKKV
jgi:hypothetical protein